MTLVAALRVQGTPVLMGDLLLTAAAESGSVPLYKPIPGQKLPPHYYPNNPELGSSLPDTKGFKFAGGHRKIVLFNGRLCLGWSGSRFGAASVLKQIRAELGLGVISLARIELLLRNQVIYTDDAIAFNLIGWIFDGTEFHCFRWNSQYPCQVFESDEHFEGSGEEVFRHLQMNYNEIEYWSDNPLSGIRRVEFEVALLAGKCFSADVVSGLTTSSGFGYGFEAIVWDGKRFRYMSEISYSTWELVKLNDAGPINMFRGPILISYRGSVDYCAIQTVQLGSNRTFCAFLSDPSRSDSVLPKSLKPIPLASKIMCFYFSVTFPDGGFLHGPLICDHASKLAFIKRGADGKEYVGINPNGVYQAMAKSRASYNESQRPNQLG